MDLKELLAKRDELRKNVEWDPEIERALIQEAARAGIDVVHFGREYKKVKKASEEADPNLFTGYDQEGLRKDLLTIAIVNTYEEQRARTSK
jgi:hypothetical protein